MPKRQGGDAPETTVDGQMVQRASKNLVSFSLSTSRVVLPAFYRTRLSKPAKVLPVGNVGDPTFADFCKQDLDVPRLNRIHKHLWLAGLPVPAKPLHQQISIGRTIVVTENADLHLVWQGNRIFIKPLPDYITNQKIWETVLCKDCVLREAAVGLLLSYIWLICHRSDFEVALEHKLVPPGISWERWISWIKTISTNMNFDNPTEISPRYIYGELRLPRLNSIYRLCAATTDLGTLIRGYHYGYRNYNTFITRNFAWLLSVIVYITVVLTAMQVGLETTQLRDDTAFNRASYGFTVFSIIAPLFIIALAALVLFGVFVDNLWYALLIRASKRKEFSNSTMPVQFELLHRRADNAV